MFQAVSKFTKGDWGELPDSDKQENDRVIVTGGAILGLYTIKTKGSIIGLIASKTYEVAIIMPKKRDMIEIVMKHELGKERVHQPVLYDSLGNRLTK